MILKVIAEDIPTDCSKDTDAPECKAKNIQKRDDESSRDRVACRELRDEYVRVCAMQGQHKKADEKEYEFCQAFENICFNIPKSEPDQATVPKALMRELKPMGGHEEEEAAANSESTQTSLTKKKKKVNFAKFCADFKNRYLYVCPDPFRFGQKAVVFCPIYSEKCHVPLPDRPVLPQTASGRNKGPRLNMIDKMCQTYRGFAERYCNNPFLTSQTQYRNACDKYWRFCGHRRG